MGKGKDYSFGYTMAVIKNVQNRNRSCVNSNHPPQVPGRKSEKSFFLTPDDEIEEMTPEIPEIGQHFRDDP